MFEPNVWALLFWCAVGEKVSICVCRVNSDGGGGYVVTTHNQLYTYICNKKKNTTQAKHQCTFIFEEKDINFV